MTKPVIMLLKLSVPQKMAHRYVHALEEFSDNITWDDDCSPASIEIYLSNKEGQIDTDKVRENLNFLLENHDLPKTTDITIEKVEEKDWVKNTQSILEPFVVEKFYIHGHKKEARTDRVNILLDPGMAFGSGTHPTTRGCLKALSEVKKTPKQVLDMGCGSGILSIAAAKLYQMPIKSVDNDPFAISSTENNAERNKVSPFITALLGDGYAALEKNETYDLILCNILAKPLCDMAPALKQHLAEEGSAILSGLLDSQADEVVEYHQDYDLKLLKKINIENWITLVFGHA